MADPQFHALVIDDDREMRASLSHLLDSAGWRSSVLSSAAKGAALLEGLSVDVVLSDVRMPGMSGLDLLAELSSRAGPPLVLMSAHGDIPTAVQAMQDGAYSFLEKPFEPRRLLQILKHAAQNHRLTTQSHRLRAQLADLSGLDRVLLGQSAGIVALRDEVVDVASVPGSVLLEGETGTGKEIVARALHRLGPRKDAAFVAINCATLEPADFDAQVFGTPDAPGLFERADGGTLFLDEIDACPPSGQAKLLRVLETGEVATTKTDVRVISATNADLSAMVERSALRADLFYRLNTFHLVMPPLRERGEDMVLLFTHFLTQLAETYEITPPELSAEDTALLLSQDWPGNVRQLRHVAERRILAARRGDGSVAQALRLADDTDEVPETLRAAVAAFERTLIAKAIRTHEGRMDAVAEALGIGRRTLNEKLVKLGLDRVEVLKAE